MKTPAKISRYFRIALAFCFVLAIPAVLLAAEELTAQLQPQKTEVHWTLGATLHTVHGTFRLKRGTLAVDPENGKVSGEIIVDAATGESGNEGRDKKMHNDVLESAKFPEIAFRPDRLEGKLAPQGESHVKVHGVFAIHGDSHEMTVDGTVQRTGENVTVTTQFVVPYEKWGLKNPSTFLLHVSNEVTIDVKTIATISSFSH